MIRYDVLSYVLNWVFYIVLIIMIVYYFMGAFGLLPKWFYKQCEGIDKETAIRRGCCEDRGIGSPVSWIFGEDNCNAYNLSMEGKA